MLRGPQGTLFGKNTTGGAVNVITAKPGPEFEASVLARGAEWGQEDLRGMVNYPITENIFGRISVASEESDGYYFNRNLGIWTGGTDLEAVTAAIRFQPGEHWTIDATLSDAAQRDDNVGGACRSNPNVPVWGGGAGHVERIFPGATQQYQSECDANWATGPYINTSDKVTFSNVDQEGAFLVAEWDSGGSMWGLDNLIFKTTASYRKIKYNYLQDRDYTSLPIDTIGTIGGVGQTNRTRNLEFLVEGDVSERLRFTAGVHYFEEIASTGTNRCFLLFTEGVDGVGPFDETLNNDVLCSPTVGVNFELLPEPRVQGGGPGPFLNNVNVWNESVGVFGHLTYGLTDNWDLDLGIRYTEDDREFNNLEMSTTGCDASINPSGLCDVQLIMNADTVLAGGFFNEAGADFSEATPMISATRHLQGSGGWLDSGMFYLLYSEGFLTGGFNTEINTRLEPALDPLRVFGPEQVENFEFGFKGTFAGGRLLLNAAVFFMDYEDKQEQIQLDNRDGRFGADADVSVVQNVASVDIPGAELELRASPWEGGFVSFDLGWLDNEFDEFISFDPSDPSSPIDLSNANLSDLSPEWSVNATIEHAFQLGNGATLTPMLGVYWQSEYEWLDNLTRNAPPSHCFQGDYSKWRTRLTYEPAARNYQVALFGYNIDDELILETCDNVRTGVFDFRHERPETWGVEFSARFGNNN